jgi:hypothetical protein
MEGEALAEFRDWWIDGMVDLRFSGWSIRHLSFVI